MKKPSQSRLSSNGRNKSIEAEFFAALERVAAKSPNNPNLKAFAAQGRLKVNFSTVALEAGRSRTLIALENCSYPNVRLTILGHMQAKVAAPSLKTTVFALRSELARQRELSGGIAKNLCDALIALRELDLEVKKLKGILARSGYKSGGISGPKVVDIMSRAESDQSGSYPAAVK